MTFDLFHPAVGAWFNRSFAGPTPAQADAWPAIKTAAAAPSSAHRWVTSPLVSVRNRVIPMPASLWSGNLRLSLVIIPVKMHSAVSTEDAISFRMIHEPTGKPIKYVKGVIDGDEFTEVPEEEIVKGYEHTKGHHVLIHPKELDDLKLEAKHTIDMVRFVDEAEIDIRYWEKPYYLTPDGDEADEGYTVIREALKQTRKVAIGQLIMGGRGHLVASRRTARG